MPWSRSSKTEAVVAVLHQRGKAGVAWCVARARTLSERAVEVGCAGEDLVQIQTRRVQWQWAVAVHAPLHKHRLVEEGILRYGLRQTGHQCGGWHFGYDRRRWWGSRPGGASGSGLQGCCRVCGWRGMWWCLL